jgi:hypothetical protein
LVEPGAAERQYPGSSEEKSETSMEATWACVSYNLIRWFGTRRKIAAEVGNAVLPAPNVSYVPLDVS